MIQVVLEIGRDGEDRLAGTIRSAGQAPIRFEGVIELLAAVEALVDRAPRPGAVEGGA